MAENELPGIMIVAQENQQWSNVVGSTGSSASATFLNSLVGVYPSVPNNRYFGDSHPSLPNYLAVTSGSNQASTDDNPPSSYPGLVGTNYLMTQLDNASIPWLAFFENMGADPTVANGATNSSGDQEYEPHHNPIAYFGSSGQIAACKVYTQSSLVSNLNKCDRNTFVWVTPNFDHTMHDPNGNSGNTATAVGQGDTFLNGFITSVQGTNWYKAGGIILIWWDEAYNSNTTSTVSSPTGPNGVAGGPTPFFIVSRALKGSANQYGLNSSAQWTTSITHMGLLNSIEQYYGLPQLGVSGSGDISSLLINSAIAGLDMPVTIQIRRDTAATWTSVNPILGQGEPALETDTGMRKIGDGATAWTSLPYVTNQSLAIATTTHTTAIDETTLCTSGTFTNTLPAPVVNGACWVTNTGTGTITVTTPSGTLFSLTGATGNQTLTQGQTASYQSNGTNWYRTK